MLCAIVSENLIKFKPLELSRKVFLRQPSPRLEQVFPSSSPLPDFVYCVKMFFVEEWKTPLRCDWIEWVSCCWWKTSKTWENLPDPVAGCVALLKWEIERNRTWIRKRRRRESESLVIRQRKFLLRFELNYGGREGRWEMQRRNVSCLKMY